MEIYKITNIKTGEYYIGLNSTSNSDYFGSGTNIKHQIEKYGKENFIKEILCLITSNLTNDNILKKIESVYINNFIHDPKNINIQKGSVIDKTKKIKYITKKKINPHGIYTTAEVSEILNVSDRTIRTYCKMWKVKKFKKSYQITDKHIKEWKNNIGMPIKETQEDKIDVYKDTIKKLEYQIKNIQKQKKPVVLGRNLSKLLY